MTTSRTNERLVGQLECYIDDMMDCFEEFVKKSMLVISVAVGTLVLMVMYALKRMIERAATTTAGMIPSSTTGIPANTECKCCQVCLQDLTNNVEKLCTHTKSLIDAYLPSANSTNTASSQVIPTLCPSLASNFTKGIKKCIISKPCVTCKQTEVDEDLKNARNKCMTTGQTALARQPSVSKNDLSTCRRCPQVIAKQTSCCSMCCGDESCSKL